MSIFVFLGAPGSGKGTQAKRLSARNGFAHFSTGDMLRKAISDKEQVGLNAERFIKNGELVPDAVMIELINSALGSLSANTRALLDGFPRTLPQAVRLDSSPQTCVTNAIYFEVPESVLFERLSGRRICKNCGEPFHVVFRRPLVQSVCDKCGGNLVQRPDDEGVVVKKRLKVFADQNSALLDYYGTRGKLTTIDGNRSAEAIEQTLSGLLS